ADPGVPGRGGTRAEPAAARERPRERVLPAPRPDNEHLHGSDPRRVERKLGRMDAPPVSAAAVEVVGLPDGRLERAPVGVEEPLEIRIGGKPVAVTMRTPGHDEEL